MYEDDFSRELSGKVVIEKVNLSRASLKEATMFRNRIFSIIDSNQKDIIIDLSKCEFMDSTFLGSLVLIHKKIKLQSGNLKLIITSSRIKEILKQSGLAKVFEIYSSIDEAILMVSENSIG